MTAKQTSYSPDSGLGADRYNSLGTSHRRRPKLLRSDGWSARASFEMTVSVSTFVSARWRRRTFDSGCLGGAAVGRSSLSDARASSGDPTRPNRPAPVWRRRRRVRHSRETPAGGEGELIVTSRLIIVTATWISKKFKTGYRNRNRQKTNNYFQKHWNQTR